MADSNSLLNGTPEEKIKAWLQVVKKDDGHHKSGDWTAVLLPHLSLVSTDPSAPHPSVTFSFAVQSDHCNRLQNLHGGCAATLFDYCTTLPLALVNRPGYWQFMGVTRTLNVTYLRPVPSGSEVILTCEIIHIGKKMAALRGTMRRKGDGAVMAVCEHGKVTIDPEQKL